jgi:hypothetical protein
MPSSAKATPTLTNVQLSDAGFYRVNVSNLWGAVDSAVAQLIVLGGGTNPPTITIQPVSVTTNTGIAVAFSITATGTAPLHYQWFKDNLTLTNDVRIIGAQSNRLSMANLVTNDAGGRGNNHSAGRSRERCR